MIYYFIMVWKNGLQRIVLLLFLWWNLVEILHYWVLLQSCLLKKGKRKKKKKKEEERSEEKIEKEKNKNKRKKKKKKKNEKGMQLLEGNSCEPMLQRPLACF